MLNKLKINDFYQNYQKIEVKDKLLSGHLESQMKTENYSQDQLTWNRYIGARNWQEYFNVPIITYIMSSPACDKKKSPRILEVQSEETTQISRPDPHMTHILKLPDINFK